MADSQNYRMIGKNTPIHPTFAINLHILWFEFSKAINLY